MEGFSAPPLIAGLQQELQQMIQSRPEWWVYSIYWQASRDEDGRNLRLSWGEGHFRGQKPNPNAIIGDAHHVNLLDELEWFYTLSVIGSLPSEDDLLALSFSSGTFIWLAGDHEMEAYKCKRAKEGHSSGVKTFVCIPTLEGILELGSSDVINPDLGLIQLCKSIGFSTDTVSLSVPIHSLPSLNPSSADLLSLNPSSAERGKVSISNNLAEEEEVDYYPTLVMPGSASSSAPLSVKRSRKRVVSTGSYLEAERGRRAKLNELFCALRGVVPNVSKMDKASLLNDAVNYIKELKTRVNELENRRLDIGRDGDDHQKVIIIDANFDVNVKVVGSEAILRVMSRDVNYPAARLMDALSQMELKVCFATISTVKDVMIQDVVVRAPNGFTAIHLKTAILARLQLPSSINDTNDL